MNELETYISSFWGVNQQDLVKVAESFQETTLKKGEYYTKRGHFCNQLSFIKSGVLRVYADYQDKEITQWIASPSSFITDIGSLVFNQESRFNIQAISSCELYTINKKDYQNLKLVLPNWPELEKLFIAKCFIHLENRVFNHLSMNSEERFQVLFQENPELFNQVPLQNLASMLGMSPETLSRIRGKLRFEKDS